MPVSAHLTMVILRLSTIHLRFTGQDLSLDSGTLLLCETDKQIGLIEQIANSIRDKHNERYSRHELYELFGQELCMFSTHYHNYCYLPLHIYEGFPYD